MREGLLCNPSWKNYEWKPDPLRWCRSSAAARNTVPSIQFGVRMGRGYAIDPRKAFPVRTLIPTTSPGLIVSGSSCSRHSSTKAGLPIDCGVAAASTNNHPGVMAAVPKELSLALIRWTDIRAAPPISVVSGVANVLITYPPAMGAHLHQSIRTKSPASFY